MASLFWGQANAEPKRQFRFELSFTQRNGNQKGEIPVWAVKTATKPVVEVSTIPHQYIDHTFNFPGRVTWQPITVTLVDPVNPDLSFAFLDILGNAGYKYPDTDTIARASLSKKDFTDTIGNVVLKQIDADGLEIERWELVNPIITNIDFGGTLSYESDDMVEVSCTITYDWAVLKRSGGPNGEGGSNNTPASVRGL
jgi:hypothetical protein